MKSAAFAGALAAVVVLAFAGTVQAQTPGEQPQERGAHPSANNAYSPPKPDVYLFNGFLPLPGNGIERLAARLAARGYAARVHSWADADAVAGEIEAAYRIGKQRGPILLIGHSLGGRAAVSIASRLQAARIPVSLIVTFDPYHPDPVPANVRHVINFYQSTNGVGSPLSPAAGFHGSLINKDLKSRADLIHRTIPMDPGVQSRVIAEITGPDRPSASAASATATNPHPASPASLPSM